MYLGGKEGPPLHRIIGAVFAQLRKPWQTEEEKKNQKKNDEAGRVNRFRSITQDLVSETNAFEKLGLAAKPEQDFFVFRFSVYLYDTIVPLRSTVQQPGISGSTQRIDPFLTKHFGTQYSIDSVLSDNDTVKQRMYKRALSIAARSIMTAIALELQRSGTGRYFAEAVHHRYTYDTDNVQRKINPLFVPTPEGQQYLDREFEMRREELIRMRVRI